MQRGRAVFIVGAGRSGTSAITRGVQALGVNLGRDFKRATRKNPSGFFEDAGLLAISKRVRRSLGLRPGSVRLIDPSEWEQPAIARLRAAAEDVIRRRFAQSAPWGFKYGRTLRILPFWEPVLQRLNMDPGYVVALRNPLSVARSRALIDPRRGTQEKSDLEWLAGIVPYFQRMRGRGLVVVDYDLLMQDPAAQLRRVARTLELTLDADAGAAVDAYARGFLKPGMQHNRFSLADLQGDTRLNPLCRDAYLLLHRLATDELAPEDNAFWESWNTIERSLIEMGPLLRLIDDLERRGRHACWNPFSFVPEALYRWRVWRRN